MLAVRPTASFRSKVLQLSSGAKPAQAPEPGGSRQHALEGIACLRQSASSSLRRTLEERRAKPCGRWHNVPFAHGCEAFPVVPKGIALERESSILPSIAAVTRESAPRWRKPRRISRTDCCRQCLRHWRSAYGTRFQSFALGTQRASEVLEARP